MRSLLVISGPTAAGKSQLAVRLARDLDGEIISADSMQIYRGFDIGTGKIPLSEQEGIPHHLLDILNPNESFSAAQFVELADPIIQDCTQRGKIVIVVGGTGLYVRGLLFGLCAAPRGGKLLRAKHRILLDKEGLRGLYLRLEEVDPDAAQRIHPNDFVRISRALEVYEQIGIPLSSLQKAHGFSQPRYHAYRIGISPPRELLRQRIDARVDAMMAQGWLSEVESLVVKGFSEASPMRAIGYRHLLAHLNMGEELSETVRKIKRDTWRYAKRQFIWLNKESGIHWFENELGVSSHVILSNLEAPTKTP